MPSLPSHYVSKHLYPPFLTPPFSALLRFRRLWGDKRHQTPPSPQTLSNEKPIKTPLPFLSYNALPTLLRFRHLLSTQEPSNSPHPSTPEQPEIHKAPWAELR
jgi:hypothetical protein